MVTKSIKETQTIAWSLWKVKWNNSRQKQPTRGALKKRYSENMQ